MATLDPTCILTRIVLRAAARAIAAGAIVATLAPVSAVAQPQCDPAPARCTWERTFGGSGEDRAYGIAPTGDGGLYVAGNTNIMWGRPQDGWLLRLSREGRVLWSRYVDGEANEQLFALATMPDGDALVAGHTRSRGAGASDVLVARIGADGARRWERIFGGVLDERARAVLPLDDGLIVAGFTESKGAGARDAWLISLDDDGRLRWDVTLGGAGDDGAFALARAEDGDVLVAGHTGNPPDYPFSTLVARLRPDGEVRWQVRFPDKIFAAGTGILETADGGILTIGLTQTGRLGSERQRWLKLDAEGVLQWERVHEAERRESLWAMTAAADSDEDAAVAAGIASVPGQSADAMIMAVEPSGEVRWQEQHGAHFYDRPTAISRSGDGSLLVAGYTTSQGAGFEDFWVLRLDERGRL